MENFDYRILVVVSLITFLALGFLFLASYRGEDDFFWQLNSFNSKGILSLSLPLLGCQGEKNIAYESWSFLKNIWDWLWKNNISDPCFLMQREIPLYMAYSRPGPREITTVTSHIQIDNHLILPKIFKGEPQIAILHTHTAETFNADPRPKDSNSRVLPAGKARGQVVDVGEHLVEKLEEKGITALHDQSIYDGIYNMSYVEARKGINNLLAKNPTLSMVIDIHRDGLEHLGREAVVSPICGKEAATIMIVVSEDWPANNARLARELATIMDRDYPGLLRRLEIRPGQSYNHDLHPGALLFEIGGVLNTLEEALYSAELLSEVIASYLKDNNQQTTTRP